MWCSHIFLHSLIFWIENSLQSLIYLIFSSKSGNFIHFGRILVLVWLFHPFFGCFCSKDLVPPHYVLCNLAINRQRKKIFGSSVIEMTIACFLNSNWIMLETNINAFVTMDL
jgi:hypothetical protein